MGGQVIRLILLDRDGVINYDSSRYIRRADEWRPIPGALEAIAQLRAAGYMLGLCSNQAGIARGKFTSADLSAIEAKMLAMLRERGADFDFIAYCQHHPDDNCSCRKPKPGMLRQALSQLAVHPSETYFVGDSLTDVKAALAANITPALVRTGNGSGDEAAARALVPLAVYDDLARFAEDLLRS